jgi:hypothetical protein
MVTGNDETRFIVRGEKVIIWEGGKYFLNFLLGDLSRELGDSFREDAHHPLHRWWTSMLAQAAARSPLGPERGLMSTVAVLSFFTVAYDLFVLADNTKPRERLVKALRIPDQFHGARYELMIAACLVRAGFSFTFSNEEDSSSPHSDGVAVHRRTGKRYAVEMKTKGRPGILGKVGERPSPAAMKGDVSRQLRDALLKPAHDERLIFIDLNLPPAPSGWQEKGVWWRRDAIASKRAVEEQPGKAVSDAFVSYLIATILEAYDWNEDVYRVPASLVVLVRHQLCGSTFESAIARVEHARNSPTGTGKFLESNLDMKSLLATLSAAVPKYCTSALHLSSCAAGGLCCCMDFRAPST